METTSTRRTAQSVYDNVINSVLGAFKDFTHIPWATFKVEHREHALLMHSSLSENDDVHDIMERDALYDDEMFVAGDGSIYWLANITGAGGSLWLTYKDGVFDEALLVRVTRRLGYEYIHSRAIYPIKGR